MNYDKENESIDIHMDGYEINSSNSMIELSKKLSYISHKKPASFDEVYKYTKRYIKDPDGSFRKIRKGRLVAVIIALILTILIGLFLEITS